jgi:hypothetical protein
MNEYATDPDVVVVSSAETIDGRDYPDQRYSPPPVGLGPHAFNIAEFNAIPSRNWSSGTACFMAPHTNRRQC